MLPPMQPAAHVSRHFDVYKGDLDGEHNIKFAKVRRRAVTPLELYAATDDRVLAGAVARVCVLAACRSRCPVA